MQISNIVSLLWDTNSVVEEHLTNQTSPLSRFMFSYVILMWSQWELLFTLICEAGVLEPSISANYTIICSLEQMIQQAVKAVPCYIDAFYWQASHLYVVDVERWNFRWHARLCMYCEHTGFALPWFPGSAYKVVSVRRVDNRSSAYYWCRNMYVDHQDVRITSVRVGQT
jgi:hypothetical protein